RPIRGIRTLRDDVGSAQKTEQIVKQALGHLVSRVDRLPYCAGKRLFGPKILVDVLKISGSAKRIGRGTSSSTGGSERSTRGRCGEPATASRRGPRRRLQNFILSGIR